MLGRKIALNFGNTVVGALLGLVALKLTAVYLGDVILGQVGYALGLAGLVTFLGDPGLGLAHTKRLSEGGRDADRVATFLATRALLLLGTLVLMAAFIGVRVLVQGKGFTSTTLLTLVIVTFTYGLRLVESASVATLDARLQTARSQLGQFLDNLVRVLATVVVALAYAAIAHHVGPLAGLHGAPWDWIGAHGAESLALTYLLGSLAAASTTLFYVLRDFPLGRFDPAILGSYWSFARPMFLVQIIDQLDTYIDKTTIGYFWGAHETGIFFAAQRISQLLQGVPLAVGALLLPAVSSIAGNLEDAGGEAAEDVAELAHRAQRYTTMVVLPLVAFFIVFAAPLIRIVLSNAFLDGVATLQVLALWGLVISMNRPYNMVLAGTDHPRESAAATLLMAVLDIGLNLLLVPAGIASLGIHLLGLRALGSAIATLLSAAAGFLLLRHLVKRHVPLQPQWHHLLRQVAAVAVGGAAMWALVAYVLGPVRWYMLPLLGIGITVVYLGTMWVLREFTGEDLRFFLEVVHPGEMVRYIREELLGRERSE